MSKARQLADLLDASGDVVTGALDNVPPISNITASQLASTLDLSGKSVVLPSASVPSLSIKRRSASLRTNLTGFSATARYSDNISSYVTNNTVAVIIALIHSHNGSASHGYATGYFCQDGQEGSENNRAYFSRSHYDWYYNVMEVEFLVPWVGTGSGNLITQFSYSFFTGDNRYGWQMKGILEQ